MDDNSKNLNDNIPILDRVDIKLGVALVLLTAFGIVMVLSASAYNCSISRSCQYDPMFFAKRQAVFAIGGIILAMGIKKWFPYRILDYMSIFLYVISIVFIFLLKTSLGVEVNHATRWLKIGIQFQVAEVVKIALILWLATIVKGAAQHMDNWKIMIMIWVFGTIPAVLLFSISNDLSSSLVILGITFGMSLIYTQYTKTHIFILLSSLGAVLACRYFGALNLPTQEELDKMSFRFGRIAAWIAPERYASSQGYQTIQALYAIGSGGIMGKGLGNGIQKLTKIPEAQNDMIFAVICEELGVVGATVLLVLFGYMVYQLVRISMSCKDVYGRAIVTGIWLQIILQVAINVSVCLNVIPNTGISLPFISYGGTSILLLMIEIGFVFSVFNEMDYPEKAEAAKGRSRDRKRKRELKRKQREEAQRRKNARAKQRKKQELARRETARREAARREARRRAYEEQYDKYDRDPRDYRYDYDEYEYNRRRREDEYARQERRSSQQVNRKKQSANKKRSSSKNANRRPANKKSTNRRR